MSGPQIVDIIQSFIIGILLVDFFRRKFRLDGEKK